MCGRTTPKEMADKLRYHAAEYNALTETLRREGFIVTVRISGQGMAKNPRIFVDTVLKHSVEKV